MYYYVLLLLPSKLFQGMKWQAYYPTSYLMTPSTSWDLSQKKRWFWAYNRLTIVSLAVSVMEQVREFLIKKGYVVMYSWCVLTCQCIFLFVGIVFNNLSGNDLSYTIRLRHEVGNDNSWETAQSGPNFELPGPRIANSYVLIYTI